MTPDANMPSFGAFEHGCAICFPLVAGLIPSVAAECMFCITVGQIRKQHVLLSNRHQTEDIARDDVAMAHEEAHDLTQTKDLVPLDGFCLLCYRL